MTASCCRACSTSVTLHAAARLKSGVLALEFGGTVATDDGGAVDLGDVLTASIVVAVCAGRGAGVARGLAGVVKLDASRLPREEEDGRL